MKKRLSETSWTTSEKIVLLKHTCLVQNADLVFKKEIKEKKTFQAQREFLFIDADGV